MSLPRVPAGHPVDAIHARFVDCTECRLCKSRKQIVPSRGSTDRPLVLLTDCVSGHDEAIGMLLSGPVDELITNILAAPRVEIDPAGVYLVSIVLCHTPGGRPATARETTACSARLTEELEAISPRAIIALGSIAAAALVDDGVEWEGQKLISLNGGETPIWQTVHPREGLWGDRQKIVTAKRRMYADWQAIAQGVKSL